MPDIYYTIVYPHDTQEAASTQKRWRIPLQVTKHEGYLPDELVEIVQAALGWAIRSPMANVIPSHPTVTIGDVFFWDGLGRWPCQVVTAPDGGINVGKPDYVNVTVLTIPSDVDMAPSKLNLSDIEVPIRRRHWEPKK